MEINDKIYFNNFINYKPKGIKKINYLEVLGNIGYITSKIRNIARDALSEEISPRDAKKEISDLLDNIKQLKKEGK
jgi:hypothetical protein